MSSIFTNLISNSIKYSLKDKIIYIKLFQDKSINFIIKDEGIGISKDELNKVTDKFYRADQSRNKKINGHGLGLSIVKNNVKLHNGSINISSELDKGTKVHIVFNIDK